MAKAAKAVDEELQRIEEVTLLREEIESLCSIYRPSASEGEREAAEWIDSRFKDLGARSRIEVEKAQGGYWLPMGMAAAAGMVGGLAALRGGKGRLLGAALGAAAAAGVWDDVTVNRRWLRQPLPKRDTYNVVAELGPEDAANTVVLIGHHDSAHAGIIFHPEIPKFLHRFFPKAFEEGETSPPIMWPIPGGPALISLGSLLGSRKLLKAGVTVSAITQLVMLDIGLRKAVPGANDNASGVVALFGVARALSEKMPKNLKVVLLSVGSEESFEEGSWAFGRRHFPTMPKESTFFICIDGVGSPNLLSLEGEGMMRMYDYPQDAKDLISSVAQESNIDLLQNMRLRNSTDGLVPLRAGYKSACIASATDLRQPINYHWQTDTPDCVSYDTVHNSVRLVTAAIERLDESWLG